MRTRRSTGRIGCELDYLWIDDVSDLQISNEGGLVGLDGETVREIERDRDRDREKVAARLCKRCIGQPVPCVNYTKTIGKW